MSIDCPACGKKSDGSPECLRCGGELAVLRSIAELAEQALDRSRESLARGEAAATAKEAKRSWQFRKSPEAARLAFLAQLAMGDFPEAGRWYARSGKNRHDGLPAQTERRIDTLP
jgi:hypothetical protein